jgi:PAS domain S-box-containing protein
MSDPLRADSPAVRTLLDEDGEEAYEHAPAGYVSALPDGTIVKANATFYAWTGYEREALVGARRLQDLLSVPGRVYYETHLGPLLAMQGSLNEVAVDIRRCDGSLLPAMINASQKRSAEGEALLSRFTVFNATDRRRYEQQLLEARRAAQAAAQAKTELLAMLSHDIRSPLGSIIAVSHLLEDAPLDGGQRNALRILKSASTSILSLVNEVLEHSRLEAVGVTLRAEPFDLRALLRELCDSVEPIAADKSLRLACDIDGRIPPLLVGDRGKLAQVLGNLLGNALKFTERGSVRIAAEMLELPAGGARLRLRVADTGIGIAEEAQTRIFGQYAQANAEIAPRYGGLGLGLAIVRKLLQAHGTDLQVRSRPGEGSEFWFDVTLRLP